MMRFEVDNENSTLETIVGDPSMTKASMVSRYREVRRTTELLAQPLTPEDCQVQSMPDASPVKWHLAHSSWFFETFLILPYLRNYVAFDSSFCYLFNSYYNAIGPRVSRRERGLMSRPKLEDVYRYREAIDDFVVRLLESADTKLTTILRPILELGLNHEQQHQELILTDIKHAFSQNPSHPVYRSDVAKPPQTATASYKWMSFGGGVHWIGHSGDSFAFDNEGPRHRVFLEGFQIATRLVTNGEYIAFIENRGYSRPELWLSDGWAHACTRQWESPLYWEHIDNSWWTMTLGGFRPIETSEPVCHISHYEADAFARWAGFRLPTEAEWETAARDLNLDGNFLENGNLHPRPAELGSGLTQCFGDVWEWTQSPYTAYPGLQPAPGALGEYNAKFMCNQMVLRGGSCATPRSHIRATYRNFFPPEARWQFTGIRLARD